MGCTSAGDGKSQSIRRTTGGKEMTVKEFSFIQLFKEATSKKCHRCDNQAETILLQLQNSQGALSANGYTPLCSQCLEGARK
jgi:hypothetical protein